MQKLVFFFMLVAVALTQAKTFTRCGLVRELRRQGFPENKMTNWVCLVENESHRRTDITGTVNKNGSRDYGLFQINDKYWCSNTSTPGKDCHVTCSHRSRDYGLFQINDKYWCSNTSTPGKDCHVTCSQLLTDDITKASTCAKKIYKRHGFMAWYGWRNHCQGKPLPDISKC